MSNSVGGFRDKNEKSDYSYVKENTYERKKRDKQLEERRFKRHEYSDDYDDTYKRKSRAR